MFARRTSPAALTSEPPTLRRKSVAASGLVSSADGVGRERDAGACATVAGGCAAAGCAGAAGACAGSGVWSEARSRITPSSSGPKAGPWPSNRARDSSASRAAASESWPRRSASAGVTFTDGSTRPMRSTNQVTAFARPRRRFASGKRVGQYWSVTSASTTMPVRAPERPSVMYIP
ncbi:hypothetical protein COSO111634_27280 [Corallococcus soli]